MSRAALLVVALTLASCRGPKAEELAMPFPQSFATVALDGHAVNAASLKGRAALLSFWSTD